MISKSMSSKKKKRRAVKLLIIGSGMYLLFLLNNNDNCTNSQMAQHGRVCADHNGERSPAEEGHNRYLLSCARFSRLRRPMQSAQAKCNHTMSKILLILLDY